MKPVLMIVTLIAALLFLAFYLSAPALSDTVEVGWSHIPFQDTLTNPCTGWYHVYTGQMYDKANNALAESPTWTDCVTSISIDTSTGIYEDTPEATMPNGEYIWRLYDSASPAYTDVPVKTKLIKWSKARQMILEISDI